MGQRSEIYVAFEMNDGRKKLTARYFGWNYAERMISRVAFTAGYLQRRIKYTVDKDSLISIIQTNFDMVDHQHSSSLINDTSCKPFKLHVHDDGRLNDGRAFIYVALDGSIKYCFTDNHNLKPLNCDEYMLFDTECCYPQYQWKNEEYKQSEKMAKCRNNIKWLEENAKVMTQEELDNFNHATYVA